MFLVMYLLEMLKVRMIKMQAMIVKLQRFISNRTTVAILCLIAGFTVLWIGYNSRVRAKVSPVTVPSAKVALPARHVITAEDIEYIQINNDIAANADNLIQDVTLIIGKEVTYGNKIPEHGLFYQEDLTEPSYSPDFVLSDIQDGYTAFSLPVNILSTYGGQIKRGNYIDLYFQGTDSENDKVIYGNLVQAIRVLDVRDGEGVSIENSRDGVPAVLLFAVPDNLYALLVRAEQFGELIPVPHNNNYTTNPGSTRVEGTYIVEEYILPHVVILPGEENYYSAVSDTGE